MASEIEMYRDNVPHGVVVLEFDDWSSAQSVITATAAAGKVLYVSSVGFIIDDGASATVGSIDLAGGDFSLSVAFGDCFGTFFVLADPFTLKVLKIDATNDVVVGEIKFNPPVQVVAGSTFTITPNTLTMDAGTAGVFFSIRGWTDDAV